MAYDMYKVLFVPNFRPGISEGHSSDGRELRHRDSVIQGAAWFGNMPVPDGDMGGSISAWGINLHDAVPKPIWT